MYVPAVLKDSCIDALEGVVEAKSGASSYLAFSENPLDAAVVVALAEECANKNAPGWRDAVRMALSVCQAGDGPNLRCAELCARAGFVDEAFQQAIRANATSPRKLPSFLLLSELFANRGEIDAALRMLELAYEEGKDSEKYAFAVGNTLYLSGRFLEAAEWAVKHNPVSRESRLLLGRSLACDIGKWEEGVRVLEAWLLEHPDDHDAYQFLTSALLRRPGSFERCNRWCIQGLQIFPDSGYLHFHHAWILLAAGEWRQGWQEYEWRWALKSATYHNRFSHPPGERDWLRAGRQKGDLIYLHGEQGAGDNFMFLKFIPALRDHFRKIVIGVYPELMGIVSELKVADEVIAITEPWPRFDAHLPIGSLPFALQVFSIDQAEKLCTDSYRPQVKLCPARPLGRPRIGLIWGGTALGPEDNRAVPQAQMAKFLDKDHGAEFVLMQQGFRNLTFDKACFVEGRWIDMRDMLPNWHETAQVMMQLDGILTIDSGPAHLAGLIGIPTAVALSWNSDWRWLDPVLLPEYESISLWYRSVRLFRAESPDDFAETLENGVRYLVRLAQRKPHET